MVGEYATAETKVTSDNTKLTQLKAQMEDDNQAWYRAATKVFKPGTPEGDMIRSSVPTTTSSPAAAPQPPTPPTPPATPPAAKPPGV